MEKRLRRAQAARDRFEEDRSALYRVDGIRVCADAEHRDQLTVLRVTRVGALRGVDAGRLPRRIEETRAVHYGAPKRRRYSLPLVR